LQGRKHFYFWVAASPVYGVVEAELTAADHNTESHSHCLDPENRAFYFINKVHLYILFQEWSPDHKNKIGKDEFILFFEINKTMLHFDMI